MVDGNKQAEVLFEAIDSFFQLLVPASRDRSGPQLLPALDVIPGQAMSPHAEILQTRATALWRLAHGQAPITVTPVASALLRIERPQHYRQLAQSLKVGDEIPLEDLTSHLESVGYEKREPVEMVGEYSVRGGIWTCSRRKRTSRCAWRLFGDEIESIRQFDVESQRSVLKVNSCTLLPLTPYQKSRGCWRSWRRSCATRGCLRAICRWMATTFRGLGTDAAPGARGPRLRCSIFLTGRLCFGTSRSCRARPPSGIGSGWSRRIVRRCVRPSWCFRNGTRCARGSAGSEIELRELDISTDPTLRFHIPTRPSMAFHGNMQVAIAEARTLVAGGEYIRRLTTRGRAAIPVTSQAPWREVADPAPVQEAQRDGASCREPEGVHKDPTVGVRALDTCTIEVGEGTVDRADRPEPGRQRRPCSTSSPVMPRPTRARCTWPTDGSPTLPRTRCSRWASAGPSS